MTDITDDQVDSFLRDAELRLRQGSTPTPSKVFGVVPHEDIIPQRSTPREERSVRNPLPASGPSSLRKDTAGSNWFNLPKTNMTAEFKRDWQLLRMRGMLDPKHHKKAMRSAAPEYSQTGEIIAGPTEFYSARLTRRERKGTLLGEMMAGHDRAKLQSKYLDIHRNKAKGKKAFYQRLVSQRRKRQN